MSLLVAETLSGSTTRTEREVSTDDLALVDAWWRTANYLAIGCWGTRVSQFLAPSPVRESRGHADDEWFVDLGG
jgi:phosphoketolase